MTMMDSSTPCCPKQPDLAPPCRQRRRLLAAALLAAGSASTPLWAQVLRLDGGILLQHEGDDVLLSTDLSWQLPQAVEQALRKGIAVHFVAQVSVERSRWYWRNQMLLSAARYYRLSYQALTRRWRLHQGSEPFNGLGLGTALGSSFAELEDALTALQRIVRWRIGARSALPEDGPALLQLRFQIDLSHLPKPLQIGALGRKDWNLLVQQAQDLTLEQL